MRRDLPPLAALRAFEAAGRCPSMSAAAAELNVTHAAVSQQVKALEGWLGVRLFRRMGRSVMLTETGQSYHRAVTQAFSDVVDATAWVRMTEEGRPLTVTTTTSFASRWLVPRLGRFQDAYPDVQIRISPSAELLDFAREDVDIAIRFGRGEWPGLDAEPLINGDLVPLCSPQYLAVRPPLKTPDDLRHHYLLHDMDQSEWRQWLTMNGVDVSSFRFAKGTVFTLSTLVYEAAVRGQGVMLGIESLAGDDIGAGRLVLPLGESDRYWGNYYIVTRTGYPLRPSARAFRDWLREEASCTDDAWQSRPAPELSEA